MSSIAFLGFLILLAATGFFYAADSAKTHAGWAVEICGLAPTFCAHPEWGIIASFAVGLLYLLSVEFDRK